MENSCIQNIKKIYIDFTNKEKIIAEYIFENYEMVTKMAITDLANELEVSKASISRFCEKVGVSGYRELKLNLTYDIFKTKEKIYSKGNKNNKISNIISEVINENISTLKICHEYLEEEKIIKLVEILFESKKIIIFATGISKTIAEIFRYKFSKFGFWFDIAESSNCQIISTAKFEPENLLLIFDIGNIEFENKTIFESAKEKNMKIALISSDYNSVFSKYSDITILSESTELPSDDGELTALLSQLNIIDVIYTLLAMKKSEEHKNQIMQFADLIKKVEDENAN